MSSTRVAALAIAASASLCACGASKPTESGQTLTPTTPTPVATSPTPTPTPTVSAQEFTVLPLELDAISYINPLGHMTVSFNALPQPRIYLAMREPGRRHAVLAPASGTVSWILGPKPDYRLEVQVSPTLKYFVDHITVEPGIGVGTRVEAGQHIATRSGLTCCLDFGVLNTQFTAAYINRRRYSPESMNSDAPLKFFAEPLQSQLYAKVNRAGDGLDGRHDYDRPGRLSGNWFLEGTPENGSLLPEHWSKQLAFAYSNTHPSTILISIAGTLAITNLCAVQDAAPDPAEVSVASGVVTYRLFQKEPPVSEGAGRGAALGVLLVQMLDDTRIRVEAFPGSANANPQFTLAAKIYVR